MRSESERHALVYSSFSLAPAALILLEAGSVLGVIYAASMVVAALYHESGESSYQATDHALAYGVIAANLWMAYYASSAVFIAGGVGFVFLGLACYFLAHREGYPRWHSAWHLCSGLAGVVLALGYAGSLRP